MRDYLIVIYTIAKIAPHVKCMDKSIHEAVRFLQISAVFPPINYLPTISSPKQINR